jgi:hypothetical protein
MGRELAWGQLHIRARRDRRISRQKRPGLDLPRPPGLHFEQGDTSILGLTTTAKLGFTHEGFNHDNTFFFLTQNSSLTHNFVTSYDYYSLCLRHFFSTEGSRGRVRISSRAPISYHLFGTQLLRRIRQRRGDFNSESKYGVFISHPTAEHAQHDDVAGDCTWTFLMKFRIFMGNSEVWGNGIMEIKPGISI